MTNVRNRVAGRGSALQRMNQRTAYTALLKGQGVAWHRPTHVYMQIASACNLDCYMCSEHLRPVGLRHGVGMQSLSRELFDKIADEVFPYSSLLTIGVGGEPTLSEHFVYFIEKAWRSHQEIHLITNGTRIYKDEIAEAIARCVSFVQMSVDAATKETYERIRLGSRWAKIRANIELFNRYRMKYPIEERTHFTLCMVLMKSNVHELEGFVELAHEFHADLVHGQHVIPVTDEGKRESLIEEQALYNRHREAAVKRAAELGIAIQLPDAYPLDAEASGVAPAPLEIALPGRESIALDLGPRLAADLQFTQDEGVKDVVLSRNGNGRVVVDRPNESSAPLERPLARHAVPCAMPTLETFIFYDGRVFPCCHPYAHRKMQVGDLTKQSFREIWNGPYYRSLRAGLMSGDVPEICKLCSIVHNPPPAYEDPEQLDKLPDLAGHYAGREPLIVAGDADLFERMATAGLVELAVDERRHANELVRHARIVDHDRHEQALHIRDIESQRDHLEIHVANLSAENEHLKKHLANVERERNEFASHASNLERILERWRVMPLYRAVGRVKDAARGRRS